MPATKPAAVESKQGRASVDSDSKKNPSKPAGSQRPPWPLSPEAIAAKKAGAGKSDAPANAAPSLARPDPSHADTGSSIKDAVGEIKHTVESPKAEDEWDTMEDVLAEDEWQDVEVGLASGAVRFNPVR